MLIFFHEACLSHEPGQGHPEHPGRLSAVLDALSARFESQLRWHEAPQATVAQIARAHSAQLITQLRQTAPQEGFRRLDADTVMSPGSWNAALRAAGAVCAAIDAVIAGADRRAFCPVRPPGHHSTRDVAMGFCLFNNIAIGACHALAQHAVERVTIVDFDVHHGNGTQDIFDADPRVQYVSSHQSPLYPGTGRSSERGVGNIENGELPPGSGARLFRQLWRETLLPRIDNFAPQLILISAGFDAHHLDPLADINLGAEDFAWITRELVDLAHKHAQGRIVSALEGGYSLAALRESSVAHVQALMDVR